MPLSILALAAALEGRHRYRIVDGNLDPDAISTVLAALAAEPHALLAVTVMPGPQLGPAIALSRAVRAARPEVPIAWGGYFPTLYPEAAIRAPYVDYVVRGQGEDTLLELLARLPDAGPPALAGVRGLTWRDGERARHEGDRPFRPPADYPPLPYARLGDVDRYLRPSFMGARTAVHQAAIGCRYRCTFCGVVSMFGGTTRLDDAGRLAAALATLRDRWGATAVQLYDHNFFDREESSVPLVEALAGAGLPWWCYARADTLAGFAPRTWKLIERSRLAMAYIGAEAASDEVLARMKKGSRVEHTIEVARRCREHRVVPEFSFVLGGPEDPAGEIEKTFAFIRRLKGAHPACEVILYVYSPTPRPAPGGPPRMESYGPDGPPLPATPEEWTAPRWVDFVCHRDAPWLTPALRRRVRDFSTVLGCRFPTVQDVATPPWARSLLRSLASWRYATGRYGRPWELDLAKRLIRPREPERESI
jgi:radical SAM superfamily enzyme YgiQ (UPF0313 family)